MPPAPLKGWEKSTSNVLVKNLPCGCYCVPATALLHTLTVYCALPGTPTAADMLPAPLSTRAMYRMWQQPGNH